MKREGGKDAEKRKQRKKKFLGEMMTRWRWKRKWALPG